MYRRKVSYPFRLFACASALLLASPAIAQTDAPQPNIIIVLVDDMGFSDLGCYGGEIETPHIDALAARGLRFTQFYNSGRCCPTRASLMTGLHPHQVGVGHMTEGPEEPYGVDGPYQGFLNDNCTTIAEVLRAAGYHTLMTGKWHLGFHDQSTWPLQRGFDRYYGGLTGAFNYFKPGGNRTITRGNDPVGMDDDFYATDAFTDVACQYISEAAADDDRPFFLYLAYNAPHWPLNAKWDDYQKYRGRYRDGWEALMTARQAKQREMGLFDEGVTPTPHVGPKWDSLSAEQRDDLDAIMAAYAACIDSIDQNIGKLVAHLDSLGEREDTLIFLLSDNGACQERGDFGVGGEEMVRNPPLETVKGVSLGLCWANACNTPFRLYKHFVHEGGACTPMIACWPNGIAEEQGGGYVRQLAYLPDFMATCVELAGATYPAELPPCAGESMAPLLGGSDAPIHEAPVFWEHEGNAAMRDGDWKLVRQYRQPWELYDVSADRTELNDLSDSEAERRQSMIAQWESWAADAGVAFPQRFTIGEWRRRQREKNAAE